MAQNLASKLLAHQPVLQSLRQSFAAGRMPGALLFAGPSGIGKKLTARALAQDILCERPVGQPTEACGECGSCLRVAGNQSESLLLIEPDGATIKVEQVRDVIQFISLQAWGKAKIIIFNEAQTFQPAAANALLKSLEEPPPSTYFILLSTNSSALLPTVRSRSQLIRFRSLFANELQHILGGAQIDAWVAAASRGSVEAAQNLQGEREQFDAVMQQIQRYVEGSFERVPYEAITELKDELKDRRVQSYFIWTLQSLIVSALKKSTGVTAAHDQRLTRLMDRLAAFSTGDLNELANETMQVERDFAGHIDRQLVLENLSLKFQRMR